MEAAMLSAERNERITLIGPGTSGGKLMRLYWQPVALSEELAGERPVRPVRLLGEDFVLFRDAAGRLGLIDRGCPHRGADLAFGRLEDGGLRCLFHGWLFDVDGNCLDTPGEPEGTTLCSKIRQAAYPVIERSGIIFAYLGSGSPPALPDFDCFVAPDAYTFAFKGFIDCNWLQALEVGIDPAHASFLHRFFEDEDAGGNYGRQFRANSADSTMPMTKVMRDYTRPSIDIETTDWGFRIITLRKMAERQNHVRVTNLLFPHAFVIPLSPTMTITQWHVPVDDRRCYWYAIFTSFDEPVNKAEMRAQRLALYTLPDYKPRLNRSNDYGYDPREQASATYTGMGFDINVHDQWAIESQGAIQDRTKEHLGQSDKAIAFYRRLLLTALDQVDRGERPIMVVDADEAKAVRGPSTLDGVDPGGDWHRYWQDTEARRRHNCRWTAPV
jgi:nitrite reductase/ring-hydroxylating ferredoxin subunit